TWTDRRRAHRAPQPTRAWTNERHAASSSWLNPSAPIPAQQGDDMTDRIADIWGERTPHRRGTVWPARVDLHLEDDLTLEDVDRWVQSECLLCSNGCGCDIAVKDGRMVGIRGRADDVVNHGRLGPKGLYGSTPWASSPDRLTPPP